MARRLLVLALPSALALDNGQGLTPPMGYSSWYDCASEVTEKRIVTIANALIDTGLAAKGYVHVNVDEGWLAGRDNKTGDIIHDRKKFPLGMKALGDYIHDLEVPGKGKVMKYGLYTSRGNVQCGTVQYHAVGSQGYEKQDAKWMVSAGADYLKEDSCGGSPNHTQAFAQYALMRDALNATGRPVYFSLCGWNTWYAPVGDSLGNSWRISGDGNGWADQTQSLNKMASLTQYARRGAWNDPDLLVGTGFGSSENAREGDGKSYGDNCWKGGAAFLPQTGGWYSSSQQSRAQFTMWCITSAPLLISANVNALDQFALETWGNEEAIYVNQNFREGSWAQGERLVGGDLAYSEADRSKPTGSGTNVWGKALPSGEFALAMISNEDTPQDVICDASCFAKMNVTAGAAYKVRDLWAHQDIGLITPPLIFTAQALPPHGGVAFFRFTPTKEEATVLI